MVGYVSRDCTPASSTATQDAISVGACEERSLDGSKAGHRTIQRIWIARCRHRNDARIRADTTFPKAVLVTDHEDIANPYQC